MYITDSFYLTLKAGRTPSRSRSPTPTSPFSDMLIKHSQRQRKRSIPPPPPPLGKVGKLNFCELQ